ncbi:MAG: hypothetical protein J6331_02500, partial [Lentisphaeria bacterium]|nr:hypothetical protein [Lentisphaeria bacterium]
MIRAGFYECDITPPLGAERPATFYKLRIEKYSDPLKIRALALSDGKTRVAVIGSDNVGCGPVFLRRLTREQKLTQYVLNMTELHMKPNMLAANGAHVKSYMTMYDRAVCREDLLLLARADHMGRLGPGRSR